MILAELLAVTIKDILSNWCYARGKECSRGNQNSKVRTYLIPSMGLTDSPHGTQIACQYLEVPCENHMQSLLQQANRKLRETKLPHSVKPHGGPLVL